MRPSKSLAENGEILMVTAVQKIFQADLEENAAITIGATKMTAAEEISEAQTNMEETEITSAVILATADAAMTEIFLVKKAAATEDVTAATILTEEITDAEMNGAVEATVQDVTATISAEKSAVIIPMNINRFFLVSSGYVSMRINSFSKNF